VSLKSLLKGLLGLVKTVVLGAEMDEAAGVLVVFVRPSARAAGRCPECGRRRPLYDRGRGRRRWRALDLGSTRVFLEADAPRVACPVHGVLVAAVPWARAGSWFTRAFEEQVAWLCLHSNRSVVAELMRVSWQSVGGIVTRVYDELDAAAPSRFDGLVNVGIDETSYKKGYKYMTVVLDHDRNRIVWAAKGHGKSVLEGFFALLSAEQKASIRAVTADGAAWIGQCVEKHCPGAVLALDAFHAVSWATDALDEVRKEAWRQARKQPAPKRLPGRPKKGTAPPTDPARAARGVKYPLLKNPENLTEQQQAALEMIAVANPRLHRAYLLKEKFRLLLKLPLDAATGELDRWLAWAQRCRIKVFVELGRKIRRHKQAILDTVRLGLSNARVEAANNKIKLTIRMGYGFRNIDNLIALVMLKCSGLPLALPGRK
jgi:transposase